MRSLWLLVAVVALAGCGNGRAGEPPRPDRTIRAESVDIADHWDFGDCDHIVVTLRSGEVIDVARSDGSDYPNCPEQSPTPFLLGNTFDLTTGADAGKPWVQDGASQQPDTGPGPLVLWGAYDGQPWLAVVRSPTGGGLSGQPCWMHRWSDEGEGAYKELHEDGPPTLHLSSGLVLPIAADFQLTYPPDPFPLRRDDAICLSADGEVVWAEVWIGGY